jgi:lysophospholipase L1-like esterase
MLPSLARAADPPPFAFKDGDRVMLIGDALIERDQAYGYLETLLTIANPDKAILFRNLGWSGDTVFGDARAGFGKREDGFKHLKEHVFALKPTVIIVGYGMSDSFEGPAGLARFVEGLNTLLDVLVQTRARIVMLTPIAHENLGPPLPDPTAHNASLRDYCAAIRRVAESRGYLLVDLFNRPPNTEGARPPALTDDGIHLSERGYYAVATTIAAKLGAGAPETENGLISLTGVVPTSSPIVKLENTRVTGDSARFDAIFRTLPRPAAPSTATSVRNDRPYPTEPIFSRGLQVANLAPGRYRLSIDDTFVQGADAMSWKRGVEIAGGPEFAQVARLRSVINDKNQLYFYRWRPQNETYLFGFRKHEQGNNAREIPRFDPLVEAREKEIATLRKPRTHKYELVREKEVAR